MGSDAVARAARLKRDRTGAAGTRPDEPTLRRALREVGASHEAARGRGVFATPTIGTADGCLGYVKLTDLPAGGDARRRLLDLTVTAINDLPELAELKRPLHGA